MKRNKEQLRWEKFSYYFEKLPKHVQLKYLIWMRWEALKEQVRRWVARIRASG